MATAFEMYVNAVVHGAQERYVSELTGRLASDFAKCVRNPDVWAAHMQGARKLDLMGLYAKHEKSLTAEARKAFQEALGAEDDELVKGLHSTWGKVGGKTVAGQWVTNHVKNVIAEAARGFAEIVQRQNVALATTAEARWYQVTAEAVTARLMGKPLTDVLEQGCAEMAAAGVETVDYKSGVKTSVDAALRRHAVTQWNQARNDVLFSRMDEHGLDLVMVSSHFGARPSHALWQGRVYSRSGKGGKLYPPLAQSTGYGTVGGLCGANCRHTMTPYIPGVSKKQDTKFAKEQKAAGKTSDEQYADTQRLRAMERRIRALKREVAVGESQGLDMAAQRSALKAAQKKASDFCKSARVPRDYSRERAYGVGGMGKTPGAVTPLPSKITAIDFKKAAPAAQKPAKAAAKPKAAPSAQAASKAPTIAPTAPQKGKLDAAAAKKKAAALAKGGDVPSSAKAVGSHPAADSVLSQLTPAQMHSKKSGGAYVTTGSAVKAERVKLSQVGTDGPASYPLKKVQEAIDGLVSGRHDDPVVLRHGGKLYFHKGAVYADAAKALGLDELDVKLVDVDAVLGAKAKAKAAMKKVAAKQAAQQGAGGGQNPKAGPLAGMGKTFTDDARAYAYHGRENFDRAKWDALPKERRDAVREYTGSYFREVNKALRDGVYSAGKAPRDVAERIDRCTEALDAFEVAEDVVVYRGIGSMRAMANFLEVTEAELDKMVRDGALGQLVGNRASDDAFMSTGVSPGKAWSGPKVVALVPKGTHALYVEPVSRNKGEKELLVQRGSRYEVVKVEQSASGVTAYVRLVGFER